MKQAAFWDSSALVPLCVRQRTTDLAHRLIRGFDAVVWWGTAPEIHGAIARAYREQRVDAVTRGRALRRLELLRGGWREVAPSDEVRSMAERFLHSYPLRAADGLQVAAAMVWCRNRTPGRVFVSGDTRLMNVAKLLGFDLAEVI